MSVRIRLRSSVFACVFLIVVVRLDLAANYAEDCRSTVGNANVLFVPGDSFFSSSFSEQDLLALVPRDETLKLNYQLPPGVQNFGGQFGYSVLRLVDLSQEFSMALQHECGWLREGHPLQFVRLENAAGGVLRELNPIRVLVYDIEFNAKEYRIGLRYNEDWNHESHTAKTRLFGRASKIVEHGVVPYVAFTKGAESVVEDWRNGPRVPSLNLRPSSKEFDPFLKHERKDEGTANVQSPCKLILLEPVPINEYYLRIEGLRFVQLSLSGEARRFTFADGGEVKEVKLSDKIKVSEED